MSTGSQLVQETSTCINVKIIQKWSEWENNTWLQDKQNLSRLRYFLLNQLDMRIQWGTNSKETSNKIEEKGFKFQLPY